MKYKNIIAIPPYYEGTSFQDIVDGLKMAVKKSRMSVEFLEATKPLKNNLKGELLDDERYIAGQQNLIKKLIGFGSVSRILFVDFFNPGFDLVRYFHEQQGYKCRYGALLHGGSFLKNDLYSWGWLKSFESAWFDAYDRIYVPSSFLANSITSDLKKKIGVFPWGLDSFEIAEANNRKTIDVIFPHRLNHDKGLDDLFNIVRRMPRVKFVVTLPQTKNTFYNNSCYKRLSGYKNITFLCGQTSCQHAITLSQSKVVLSCAKQENFGYAVMKAVLSGCFPVLPNRLCYPEFFDKEFLYNNIGEAITNINKFLDKDTKKADSIEQKLSIARNKIMSFSFESLLKDFFNK